MTDQELTLYMNGAIRELIGHICKSSLRNPRETFFLMKFLRQARNNERIRMRFESEGEHIPAYLIASITHACNLFCAGCYSRANGSCAERPRAQLMSAEKWGDVFTEAEALGVSFILLAGGEPMLRRDVLERAAKRSGILFPVFTNGTLIDAQYASFLDDHRNLVPILSIEGGRERTDGRRGQGTYDKLQNTMALLHKRGILFGASITVTTENLAEVTSDAFLNQLSENGCKVLFYVEYVPADRQSYHLAPTDTEREQLDHALSVLRKRYSSLFFISFPGDEKNLGGCVAAGRSFFHINPYGGAEPCPFSPYSDRNLLTHTLREALQSPLFAKLREAGAVGTEHVGGCALFEQEDFVKQCTIQ